MSEVSFRVIENYQPSVDYDEFKKDFLNPSIRVPELKEKYGLSKGEWRDYRQRVLDDEGITRKPYRVDNNSILRQLDSSIEIRTGYEYIQRKDNGYVIVKRYGDRAVYFGRYATIECAMKIRDILWESGWDMDLANKLKSKYSLTKLKTSQIKAMRIYDDFEHEYIYSDKKVGDIYNEMKLSSRIYSYLLEELHNRHGWIHRNKIREKFGVAPIMKKRK